MVALNPQERLLAPCAGHWFGTDAYGRDVFTRVLYGSRYSLFIGIVTSGISMVLGILIGASCAYFGGLYDIVVMRVMDSIVCIPSMLLMLALVAVVGKGMDGIIIALIVSSVPGFARIIRSIVLNVVHQEYVEAVLACGTRHGEIIVRHVLPNCFGPILVDVLMNVSSCIMAASSLSYLGMGIQVPAPEWGAMLSDATPLLRAYPYLAIFPGIAIVLTSLCFNLIGDGCAESEESIREVLFVSEENLITVSGLRTVLPSKEGREVSLVDGIDLTIPRGKTVGLVGESGCGKSTLGRLVIRLLEPSKGKIFMDGVDLSGLKGRELRKMRSRMQMVFQDPFSSLDPHFTVGEIIAEPLRNAGVPKEEQQKQVLSLMERVGLPGEHYFRYPHQFSGGQLCEICPTQDAYEHPLHPYTRMLIDSAPDPDPDVSRENRMLLQGELPSPVNPPAGCRFCTRCPYATEECKTVRPEMKDYGNGRFCACHHPLA